MAFDYIIQYRKKSHVYIQIFSDGVVISVKQKLFVSELNDFQTSFLKSFVNL